MKRFFTALTICIFVVINFCPANAAFLSNEISSSQQTHSERHLKNEIKKIFNQHLKYAQKHNLDALSELYDEKFMSSDGFDKTIYFKLIEDTWNSYENISYTTEITNIEFNENTAKVSVFETAVATTLHFDNDLKINSELTSFSNGTYFLAKNNGKWKFTGEKVNNEKSFLKYGDTRFVNMDLNAPLCVKPNEYYTSALTIDLPPNTLAVASIGREKITYPQDKSDETFRKIPDDNILERMFYANTDGKNEYNVASVGLSKSEIIGTKIKVYMTGIAFIITRVNVEENNAEKDK